MPEFDIKSSMLCFVFWWFKSFDPQLFYLNKSYKSCVGVVSA